MGSGTGGGASPASFNPYTMAAQAGIQAVSSGVSAFFGTQAAKAQARAQQHIAEIQAQSYRVISKEQAGSMRSQASVVESNRIVQDIENRQMLQRMGRQQSALTASYKDVQGSNVAQAAAGNVDISSGSAARVQEGNAFRYAQEVAAMRRAYDLQRWSGESRLAMMSAQAQGIRGMAAAHERYGEYMGQGMDAMAGAYRTMAHLQGSAFGNALMAGGYSLATSFLNGSFSGLFNGPGKQTATPATTASPMANNGYNAVGYQNPSYYESMGVTL